MKIIFDISGLEIIHKSLVSIHKLNQKNESKMNTENLETLALYVTERFRNTDLAEDFKTLAPLIGLFVLVFIGSCVCYRCSLNKADKKTDKRIDGGYVKYGTYFDRAYNEKINENDSDEQRSPSIQIHLEIEPQQKKRRSTAMDPPIIDKQPENIER